MKYLCNSTISTEETSNDEEDEEEWEVGAPREVIETNIYDRSEGPERHRQFDMKQLLTEQDEDTFGEYLKKKYADSHERRYVTTMVAGYFEWDIFTNFMN